MLFCGQECADETNSKNDEQESKWKHSVACMICIWFIGFWQGSLQNQLSDLLTLQTRQSGLELCCWPQYREGHFLPEENEKKM